MTTDQLAIALMAFPVGTPVVALYDCELGGTAIHAVMTDDDGAALLIGD